MLILSTAALAVSCKRRAPADTAPASPAASAAIRGQRGSSDGAEAVSRKPRCRTIPDHGKGFFLAGASRGIPGVDGGTDDDDDLPFAPEIGAAVSFRQGFAVGALDPARSGQRALAILAGDEGSQRIELGSIHGDVLPPVVATAGDALLVAVPDGAPSGKLIRLARVEEPGRGNRVTWGSEIAAGHDPSGALSLEVGDRSSVLLWDDMEGGRSVIRGVTFAPGEPKKTAAPRTLSPPGDDAESPLVVRRQGGFWAAWISAGAPGKVPEHRKDLAQDTEPVEQGPRWVTVMPLDEAGQAASGPIAVTSRTGHATAFDVVEGSSGSALVVSRDDVASKAPSGAGVRLALVRPDGSVDLHVIPGDDELGASSQAFLVGHEASGARRIFLSLSTDSEPARLASLDAEGRALEDASAEPALGRATPLAMNGGTLLVARPRGGGVSLELFSCELSAPAGKEAPGP